MPCRVDGSHMFQPYIMASQNTSFFSAVHFRIEGDRMLQAYVMSIIKSVILHKCNRKNFIPERLQFGSTFFDTRPGTFQSVQRLAMSWTVRVSKPGGARNFAFSTPIQTGPGAHPLLCSGYRVSFPGVKRPRRDVNQSFPSRTEFKRGLSYTPNPPPRCHRWHITVWLLPFDFCVLWYINFLITSTI
jgi:hypothetical protein